MLNVINLLTYQVKAKNYQENCKDLKVLLNHYLTQERHTKLPTTFNTANNLLQSPKKFFVK